MFGPMTSESWLKGCKTRTRPISKCLLASMHIRENRTHYIATQTYSRHTQRRQKLFCKNTNARIFKTTSPTTCITTFFYFLLPWRQERVFCTIFHLFSWHQEWYYFVVKYSKNCLAGRMVWGVGPAPVTGQSDQLASGIVRHRKTTQTLSQIFWQFFAIMQYSSFSRIFDGKGIYALFLVFWRIFLFVYSKKLFL